MSLAAQSEATEPAGGILPPRDAGIAGPLRRRRPILVEWSPLARRIIGLNLVAILLLVAGMLALNPFRDSLILQREAALAAEADLVARVFEAELAHDPQAEPGLDPARTLADLHWNALSDIFVFDARGRLLTASRGVARNGAAGVAELTHEPRRSLVADLAESGLAALSGLLPTSGAATPAEIHRLAQRLAAESLGGTPQVRTGLLGTARPVPAAAAPIRRDGAVVGAVALVSGAEEIADLLRVQIAQLLELAAVAAVISVGLSVVLASAIATPLSDLAAAAEAGQVREAGGVRAERIAIPDLSARGDEIGRLSTALRGLVAALCDRIDANEQFAADVTHEIKNPLASLRSAAEGLRRIDEPERRVRLLDVIDHDVRRLNRLVTDVSDASRLDSEMVREGETFDLRTTLARLVAHLGDGAGGQGIALTADLPDEPLRLTGLESRLAQVFVNIISNAVSFSGPGDAIAVRASRQGDRILVAVEDAGPGIPPASLDRIFERFYSERPAGQFGNNSGLGLAISRQIVEAHGGTVWAENITPATPDAAPDPIGARFVVSLPA